MKYMLSHLNRLINEKDKLEEYIKRRYKRINTDNVLYDDLLLEKDEETGEIYDDLLFLKKNNKYLGYADRKEIKEILKNNFLNNLKIKFKKNPVFYKSIVENDDYFRRENYINNDFVNYLYDLISKNKYLFNLNDDIKNIEINNYNPYLIKNFTKKSINYYMTNNDHYFEIKDELNLICKLTKVEYREKRFNDIKEKIIKLNNVSDLIKNISMEYFEDIIKEKKIYHESEKIIKNYFKKEYAFLLNEENENLIEKILRNNISFSELKKEFLKKIKIYKNENDLSIGLNNYLMFKSGWDIGLFKKKFLENNVSLKEIENNVLLVKIDNYEQSKKLGSPQWCISYSENHFNEYKKPFKEQYFLYNFNLKPDDGNSLVGITLGVNSNIEYIFNRFDKSLSINDFDYIFTDIKNEDYIINKIKNSNENSIYKIIELIKKDKIKYAKNLIENNSYNEFNNNANNILCNWDLNDEHIKILSQYDFFENVDNLDIGSLYFLYKKMNNIKNFENVFIKSFSKLDQIIKMNLIFTILQNDDKIKNNKIQDFIILDFIKDPSKDKLNRNKLINILINEKEKYLNKIDIIKIFDHLVDFELDTLNHQKKIKEFVNFFDKNDLKKILIKKIKNLEFKSLILIDDVIFDKEIIKLKNEILNNININYIYNNVKENRINNFTKDLITDIINRDENLLIKSDDDFLYNDDIRELILKNKKINIDEYFSFLCKRMKYEKYHYCDKIMTNKVLKYINENYKNGCQNDEIINSVINLIKKDKKIKKTI